MLDADAAARALLLKMSSPNPAAKVVLVDHHFDSPDTSIELEEKIISRAGGILQSYDCSTEQEVMEVTREADVVLFRAAAITEAVIENLQKCRALIRYGIGLDKVDLDAATRRGIAVCNSPEFCINEMADHTVAMVLALSRRLAQFHLRAQNGDWKLSPEVAMPGFRSMLFGSIGLGRIACAVMNRLRPFGFHLSAFDPFATEVTFDEHGVVSLELEQLLARVDVISLHAPLTNETRGLINADRLKLMKPTAIIINTARGGLIDTTALTEALRKKRIAAAGLDVTDPEPLPPDHPLLQMPNVLITPHVGWYSEMSRRDLQIEVAEEAARAIRGEELKHQIL